MEKRRYMWIRWSSNSTGPSQKDGYISCTCPKAYYVSMSPSRNNLYNCPPRSHHSHKKHQSRATMFSVVDIGSARNAVHLVKNTCHLETKGVV